jgi:hypothetical protein
VSFGVGSASQKQALLVFEGEGDRAAQRSRFAASLLAAAGAAVQPPAAA